MEAEDQVVVVMVPFPAQSHLNQLLQLSHLIASYGIQVHYVGSAAHNHQVSLRDQSLEMQTLGNGNGNGNGNIFVKIKFNDFKLGPYSTPPPDPNALTNTPSHMRPLRLATVTLREPIFGLLKELAVKYRRVIVVHDSLMASVVQDVKSVSNAEVYTFHVTSAFTLFFNRWQSMADKPFQLDVDDIYSRVPSNEGYNTTSDFTDFIISQTRLSLELASGSINNTCRLIEDRFIELFKNLPMNSKIRHFPLGPFNPIKKKIDIIAKECNNRHRCLQWLDQQEINSVIYVSFGTLTSMTDEQIAEIGIGLEKSGQKFIWVLRFADKGDIFTEDETARQPKLPEKYHERVKNRGLVVTEWVPQLDILAHPSIGGFMSHCGWGSCVESISMGVAIAAWPITSDQPKNAFLVTEVLGVGVAVREWEHRGTVVVSSTVENAIRKLMQTEEGTEIRKRAAELGSRVRASCAKGGSSRLELDSFISHITRS